MGIVVLIEIEGALVLLEGAHEGWSELLLVLTRLVDYHKVLVVRTEADSFDVELLVHITVGHVLAEVVQTVCEHHFERTLPTDQELADPLRSRLALVLLASLSDVVELHDFVVLAEVLLDVILVELMAVVFDLKVSVSFQQGLLIQILYDLVFERAGYLVQLRVDLGLEGHLDGPLLGQQVH